MDADERIQRRSEIVTQIDGLANQIGDLQAELRSIEDEGLANPNSCPQHVRQAIDALKVIYRSMRMEHTSTSKRVKSPDGTWEEASEEHTSKARCRSLRKTEADAIDACCRAIANFVSEVPDDSE